MSPIAPIPYALTFKTIIKNKFISSLTIMRLQLECVTIYNQSITESISITVNYNAFTIRMRYHLQSINH